MISMFIDEKHITPAAIEMLPERERTILNHRHLFKSEEDFRTLKELGIWFGVSATRVRQIENRLRIYLEDLYEDKGTK